MKSKWMRIYLEVLGKNAHSNFFNMESFLRLIACLLTPDFSAISAMLIPLKTNWDNKVSSEGWRTECKSEINSSGYSLFEDKDIWSKSISSTLAMTELSTAFFRLLSEMYWCRIEDSIYFTNVPSSFLWSLVNFPECSNSRRYNCKSE